VPIFRFVIGPSLALAKLGLFISSIPRWTMSALARPIVRSVPLNRRRIGALGAAIASRLAAFF
jgi:hypothetical protein